MKNKKVMKSIMAMFVMILAFSCFSITAEAATKTKKMTMYVGETFSYSYIGMGNIKSVKSNKKSVVTAKKIKNGSTVYNQMTAKKKGSAKVTVKGTRGTYIYKITVKKKPNIVVSITPRTDGYATVTVNNKSSVYIENVNVEITYRNAAGTVIGDSTARIYCLGAKNKFADQVYPSVYPYRATDIDWSKTTYKIVYDRNPEYKYSNYTKKVKYTYSVKNGYLNIKTKISYKGNNSVYAGYTVYFYDAAGNVVDVDNFYNYLSGSNAKYRTSTYTMRMPSDAVTYKISKMAYMIKR